MFSPIYFYLARAMAPGGSRLSGAALPLWGAEKAGSGSLGQRNLAPPGSFISHLLAVGSSSFIGDRDPGLVDGGREPEKEVVDPSGLTILRIKSICFGED